MDEKSVDLLKSEYLHIQSVIEGFDSKILLIKGWSVSFSFVVIGTAFTSGYWIVLLLAFFSSLIFWYLESYWKAFQICYYSRVAEIEMFFAGKNKSIVPMQIGSAWIKSWRDTESKNVLKYMGWRHVLLPHAIVAILALSLILLHHLGLVPILRKV